MIKLDKQDKLLDKVSSKTHVSKSDINNQDNIKDFVNKISKLTNKQVRPEQMNKIINIIQNNQVPTDIDKFM